MNLATISHLTRFGADLTAYLPRRRAAGFLRAWVFGNALAARRRAQVRAERDVAPPGNLNVTLTERCNLRCEGCYASAYARAAEMTPHQLERILADARATGVWLVGILGGEPFLKRDMLPVLARHPDLAFRITTNGTLIDDEVATFLEENPHVVTFFSLEGLRAQTDAWRGDGVYDGIHDAMTRLRDRRVLFGFSTLLHRENLEEVVSGAFIPEMRALGNRFAAFFAYGPVGANPRYDLVVPEHELRAAVPALERRAAEAGLLIKVEGFGSTPGSPFGFLNGPGCQAGSGVHVLPNGDVEPCNGIQFTTANLLDTSLVEVLSSPFYRRICSTVKDEGHRCIAIYRPERVKDAVDAEGARDTNRLSRRTLESYVARCGPACTGCQATEETT